MYINSDGIVLRNNVHVFSMPSFYELRFLWDGACSIPIGTVEQRGRAKGRILQLMKKNDVVRCFKDGPGFLMIAHRRPRLDDYFKSWGASREKVVV